MPPKLRFLPMTRDEQVLDARNKAVEEWLEHSRSDGVCQKVREFITGLRCKSGRPKRMHSVIKGGYNLVYRLEYEDGYSIIMRVPIKDVVPFPDEKVNYEVSTMLYVAANTRIPVPHVYFHGSSAENPTGLGPFIVMDYIEHYTNMSRELLDPTKPVDSRPVLDPNISEEKLELLYGEMAKILLQLYSLGPFPKIGSLAVEGEEDRHHSYSLARISPKMLKRSTSSAENTGTGIAVRGRPLTVNMLDLMTDTSAPRDLLPAPSRSFGSAKDWYRALGAMHMAQLVFQERDCAEDEDDARDKYVGRRLFEGLAASGRLFSPWDSHILTNGRDSLFTHDQFVHPSSISESNLVQAVAVPSTDFRLFSEDFRPANVLLDQNLEVVGVIDWEFVYSAPSEFTTDPPWWLLLSQPEDYPGGISSWIRDYNDRLHVFLRALEREEGRSSPETKKNVNVPVRSRLSKKKRRDKEGQKTEVHVVTKPLLSQHMRESWESGRWMVNYAARKSWMFDLMWWRFLDEAYFGANEDQDHKARIGTLTTNERKLMEDFVQRKMDLGAVC